MVLMCADEVINEYKVSENSICKMELTNKHINNSKDWTVIGLVGEGLASKLFNYFKDWKLYRVNASISDETHKAPERTWVLDGGGFKILCKSFLYGRCL